MSDIYTFMRVEQKYLIRVNDRDRLLSQLGNWLVPDEHGPGTVSSLYLDTPDFRLIRNSMDARVYKEKLRLRSYGIPNDSDKVFLEIKKKYKGVVYKRRASLPLFAAMRYLEDGKKPFESQIMNEIDQSIRFYRRPKPAMLISYDRVAYTAKDFPGVRLTFDTAVRYRTGDLFLEKGSWGERILPEDRVILEIKTGGAMPLDLVRILSYNRLYPCSFSKYKNSFLRAQMQL